MFHYTVGILAFVIALWMMSPKVSTSIRESRYWVIGWLGYLLLIIIGAKSTLPLWDGLNIDDEQAIPMLFVGVFIALMLVTAKQCYSIWKTKKSNFDEESQ